MELFLVTITGDIHTMLPATINYNTYLTYTPTTILENNRKIKSENFLWSKSYPKALTTLCVEKISEYWLGTPKLDQLTAKDQELLLNILNSALPIELLVENIESDIFWKRCYKEKFKDHPILPNGKKWINAFIERYFADVLENLNPRNYDPEKISSLVKLCAPYIQNLRIQSLIPVDIPEHRTVSPEMAGLITSDNQKRTKRQTTLHCETVTRDHISLNAALGSLTNLIDLHITYQLRHTDINYRKDQFQFTENDAKNLARGLEKCVQLSVLRITRTDMNSQKLKYVLRGLSENEKLETVDFSHCKIGDEGLLSLSKFIMRHESLRNLIIVDNDFGPNGAEYISHALIHPGCNVRNLDLRLNYKLGSEGIAFIAVSIARGCNLTQLNISGCGIKPGPLAKTPSGVWSTISAETTPTCGNLLAKAIGLAKTPLRSLDISVNNIGSPSDFALANAICLSNLIDVNLRRSGMGSMAVAIGESAAAAQRLRREAEKGIKFKRSAGRLLQARRVVRGMNIDADPMLLAQQLSARPSLVSVASEEGFYTIQTQPLPTDFGFVPSFKSPLQSSRASSISGPPTSRRSSHHAVLEPVKEIQRSLLIRRGSDGSLLHPRNANIERHIKIVLSENLE